jgi:hypothetical protein
MIAYLEAHGASRWDVRYVARHVGIDTFADLHDSGYASICLDPEVDGGGREITLAELIIAIRGES